MFPFLGYRPPNCYYRTRGSLLLSAKSRKRTSEAEGDRCRARGPGMQITGPATIRSGRPIIIGHCRGVVTCAPVALAASSRRRAEGPAAEVAGEETEGPGAGRTGRATATVRAWVCNAICRPSEIMAGNYWTWIRATVAAGRPRLSLRIGRCQCAPLEKLIGAGPLECGASRGNGRWASRVYRDFVGR